jgi:hypothetical protein
MTTIRTGNRRRRAKEARSVRSSRRYASFDFETCGLDPMTSEGILAANAGIVYFVDRQPEFFDLGVPSNASIEDITRTIDAFTRNTHGIPALSRFADYAPEILVNRGDNADPTSLASQVEKLKALVSSDPILKRMVPLPPRSWERPDDRIAFDRTFIEDALTEEERLMIEDTLATFAKPDEGISPEHAARMNAMPTVDEFVDGLPDGLPDDQPED